MRGDVVVLRVVPSFDEAHGLERSFPARRPPFCFPQALSLFISLGLAARRPRARPTQAQSINQRAAASPGGRFLSDRTRALLQSTPHVNTARRPAPIPLGAASLGVLARATAGGRLQSLDPHTWRPQPASAPSSQPASQRPTTTPRFRSHVAGGAGCCGHMRPRLRELPSGLSTSCFNTDCKPAVTHLLGQGRPRGFSTAASFGPASHSCLASVAVAVSRSRAP